MGRVQTKIEMLEMPVEREVLSESNLYLEQRYSKLIKNIYCVICSYLAY